MTVTSHFLELKKLAPVSFGTHFLYASVAVDSGFDSEWSQSNHSDIGGHNFHD